MNIPETIETHIGIRASTKQLTAVWWGVAARFLVHGLVVSTWVSRIPAVQGQLHLSNGALGMALLGAAIGSVSAVPVCGWLVSRHGSSRISTWTSVGFCVALVLPAVAIG